ncbi:hypothetical protein, partial [Burkholderia multivorans]|uniref:hypothetical protein n=5 Tax=Burkholderia multivorans TaxID=87883 RepID=UPI00286FDF9D
PEYERNSPRMSSNSYVNLKIATCLVRYADDRLIDQRFPSGTRFVRSGFFHADEDIAFSVVRGRSWDEILPDAPYSEFNWASPEELRLMVSLLLCERRDGPYVSLYPVVRYGPLLDVSKLDLRDPTTVVRVRELIIETAASVKGQFGPHARIEGLLGRKYDLVEPNRYGFDRLSEIWAALRDASFVFFRGGYTLIKADMLSRHYEFSEEAIVSLYIALEASFSLVQRKLQARGNDNPTAHDAAVWLHEHFDAPFGLPAPDATEKYFESFYEERIMTMHPASRYGDMPYAPIMHDDIPHLRRSLREIFAYLLLDEHGPDYDEDVDEHVKRTAQSAS